MEPFTVDKSFYDIGTSDLKELWEADLDPTISEVLRAAAGDAEMTDWTGFLQASSGSSSTPSVVLHDRLMTDAALGAAALGAGAAALGAASLGASCAATLGAPIKTEHSYCSLDSADIDANGDADADSTPDSEMSALSASMDDMDDECFPCIPMKNATTQRPANMHVLVKTDITVKDEPLSESEPASPASSCPMSPGMMSPGSPASSVSSVASSPPPLAPPPPPPPLTDSKSNILSACNGSTNGLSNLSNSGSAPHQQSLLKQPTVLLTRNAAAAQNRLVMPKLNIKVESSSAGFSLPPTPPSSTASDSEGNDLHPSSPSNRQQQSQSRLLLSPPPSSGSGSTRQPIQTSLISSQPKGSTGMLLLTDEEKRTLLAEGYPIPTRLPLSKTEEKSLKKIRRKIKNKISAQESRRKKKEYMDALERKVEILTSENSDYRKKIENLEDSNDSLVSQLNKLQALVARASSSGNAALLAAAAALTNPSTRNSRHSDSFSHTLSSQALARSSVK